MPWKIYFDAKYIQSLWLRLIHLHLDIMFVQESQKSAKIGFVFNVLNIQIIEQRWVCFCFHMFTLQWVYSPVT